MSTGGGRLSSVAAGEAIAATAANNNGGVIINHAHGKLLRDHQPFLRAFTPDQKDIIIEWQQFNNSRSIVISGKGVIFYQYQNNDDFQICAIHLIFVLESYRRQGIGSALLASLPSTNVIAFCIDDDHYLFWIKNDFQLDSLMPCTTCAYKNRRTLDIVRRD